MMDKSTYLAALEQELGTLTPTDRQNVLAYYHEFLEDAEAAGETDANTVLGNPHALAAQIKADIAMSDLEGTSGTYQSAAPGTPGAPSMPWAQYAPGTQSATGAPWTQSIPNTPNSPAWAASTVGAASVPGTAAWAAPGAATAAAAAGMPSGAPYRAPGMTGTSPSQDTTRKSGIGVVWTVILAILAIPIGIPLAIAVVSVIFAVLVTLISLLFSFLVVVVALFAAGILSTIVGLFFLFSDFAVGLFYTGSGLMLLGICVLTGMGLWHLGKLCIKGVAKLFNSIRRKLTKQERSAQ